MSFSPDGPKPPLSCPWQGLAEYGAPNVKWCEERLCEWINEPANAWSNLAYLLVAAWLLFLTRGGKSMPHSLLRFFAPVIAIIGACSFLYHASNVYLTQMLDFLGMYLFCCLLLLLNTVRLRWLSLSAFPTAFVSGVILLTGATALLARYHLPIQGLVSLLTLGIVLTELLIHRRAAGGYSLRVFWGSFVLLVLAAACSGLDLSRKWCDPTNHILQGHAAWHVLSALSLLVAFYHYRRFGRAAGGVLVLLFLYGPVLSRL